MRFTDYVRDKLLAVMLQVSCMMALAAFLYVTGYPSNYILVIIIIWILLFALWFLTGFFRRRRYFSQIKEILEQADQKYLLGELMPHSFRLEDNLYRDMIRISNKSVIEKIRAVEDARQEYREYIESWVHEIKAPMADINLLCENLRAEQAGQAHLQRSDYSMHKPLSRKNQETETYTGSTHQDSTDHPSVENHTDENHIQNFVRRILQENRKTENYVDMALFYARSDEVYKDYLIKETTLQETAVEVLQKNKYYLIQNGIQAEVDCRDRVYTDTKWISFILNQLVLNAVKYRRDNGPKIRIYTEKMSANVRLTVEDNGIGIPGKELPRIFDKGFTGSNGRTRGQSTGMGLYLCRKLCTKLGIKIYVESEESVGTRIFLEFPVASYLIRQ